MNNVEWRVAQAESGFAPLTTIDLMKWRRKAAIVVQDPPIFNTTVRENIAWPDTVPDEDKVAFCC